MINPTLPINNELQATARTAAKKMVNRYLNKLPHGEFNFITPNKAREIAEQDFSRLKAEIDLGTHTSDRADIYSFSSHSYGNQAKEISAQREGASGELAETLDSEHSYFETLHNKFSSLLPKPKKPTVKSLAQEDAKNTINDVKKRAESFSDQKGFTADALKALIDDLKVIRQGYFSTNTPSSRAWGNYTNFKIKTMTNELNRLNKN